jgi:hypothetical protein
MTSEHDGQPYVGAHLVNKNGDFLSPPPITDLGLPAAPTCARCGKPRDHGRRAVAVKDGEAYAVIALHCPGMRNLSF